MLAGLLRCLAALLGEHRRAWMHALLAETGDQPTPSARLTWLGGGLWLVAREVLRNRAAMGALRGHLRCPPAVARPDGLPERA